MTSRTIGYVGAFVLGLAAMGSGAVATATPTDESQIRQVVAEEQSALQAVDAYRYSATYCGQYRDQIESTYEYAFTPPPFEKLQGADPANLRNQVKKVFPGASSGSVQAFVDAVGNGDRGAYSDAWRALWVDTFSSLSYRLKSVDVTGDSADATVTIHNGGRSGTGEWTFAREDGDWKDCTPPPPSNSNSAVPGVQASAPDSLLAGLS